MGIRRILAIFTLSCLLAVSFFVFPAKKAQALSVSDYFVYTYDFLFSQSTITDNETFYVTVSGQAECIQDLPLALNATEAYMESTIVASLAGSEVVLNENYTLSYPDFPSKKGETASASIQVPLSFPSGSISGAYTITGYLNIARVKVLGIWISVTGYLPSYQSMGTVTYQHDVGGGSGSTGANPVINLTQFMDESGVFIEDIRISSIDKIVELQFSTGTRFAIPGGIGDSVSIKSVEEGREPATTESNQIIGLAYNIEPEGASFSIPVKITFSYDEASLPNGVQEKDIVIVWWDSENTKWVPLEEYGVDEIANIVTGLARHFTIFAIIIDISPSAHFVVSPLIINPISIEAGETVTITVEVENNGGKTDTLILILKINESEYEKQNVTLDPGSSETIDFVVSRNVPGTYNVNINGQSGSFIVELIPQQVSDQTTSGTESPSSQEPDQLPELQSKFQTETLITGEIETIRDKSTNAQFIWWQVVVSLAAGMVIGGFVLLLLHNRRKT